MEQIDSSSDASRPNEYHWWPGVALLVLAVLEIVLTVALCRICAQRQAEFENKYFGFAIGHSTR